MTSLQVFDKPMCCTTGFCGPTVDPVLTCITRITSGKFKGVRTLCWATTHQRDLTPLIFPGRPLTNREFSPCSYLALGTPT